MQKPRFLIALCAAALIATTATAAFAQNEPIDRRTFFTFSQPVQLPGVTLPAGKYIFRLVDATTSRRTVQVVGAEDKKVYAMMMSIPQQRLEAPRDTEVRFMEVGANVTPPIKSWWYPGVSTGYEFIYPRSEAIRLAKLTNESVLSTKTETTTTTKTEEFNTAELSRVSPSGADTAVELEASAAASGSPQHGQVAAEATSTAAVGTAGQAAGTQVARANLPRTASAYPFIALVGFSAMTGGFILRRRRLAAAAERG
jgi:hypothetical protein